jgi:hypothetical protein
MLGPRLVRGQDLFKRAEEPAQTLRQLLKLRTRLVHPKMFPRRSSGDEGDDPELFAIFNPLAAAQYLVAVATAAARLLTSSKRGPRADAVMMIGVEQDFFLNFGKAVTEQLPPLGVRPPGDLLIEAIIRRQERSKSEAERAEAREIPAEDSTDG